MEQELERCGACGAWQQDPSLYSEDQQNNAKLVHCGCEEEELYQPTVQEMAEAGIISLDRDGNPM